MPIEIRELHIKAEVTETNAKRPQTSAEDPSQNSNGKQVARDSIIAECVEKVLEILNQKAER